MTTPFRKPSPPSEPPRAPSARRSPAPPTPAAWWLLPVLLGFAVAVVFLVAWQAGALGYLRDALRPREQWVAWGKMVGSDKRPEPSPTIYTSQAECQAGSKRQSEMLNTRPDWNTHFYFDCFPVGVNP